ncbi:MAG: glycoside hydrolase family 5 protein [Spirochaetaceae bacterium]|nr:glycoside hydrolase family 5 protein [Spirochaetaceae bacterium]
MKIKYPFIAIFAVLLFSCISIEKQENIAILAKDFIDESLDTDFIPKNKAQEVVYNMEIGWNLGNTLDATLNTNQLNEGLKTEISWGQPRTTQEMIQGLAKNGIKTIRIPISWHNHIIDQNYTIDEEWFDRVKTIVDWAIEENMYVIINTHHDNSETTPLVYGAGYYPSSENKEESLKFLCRIWEQISTVFNYDYDERLIFEIMNEPRLRGHEHEWNFVEKCELCKDSMKCVNEYNQKVLDVIRASGGNNATRLVMIPSIGGSPDSAFSDLFEMPKDSAENALILSVHMYTPYEFAMGVPGGEKFTSLHKQVLNYYFFRLNQKFVSKGIPVVIGEMGATNKNNLEERAKWFAYFIQHSRIYGVTSCLWDNGNSEPSTTQSEKYGYYNRIEKEWYFPLLMEIILECSKVK